MPKKNADINSIYAVIRQREEDPIDFYNPSRKHSGFLLFLEGKGSVKYIENAKSVILPIENRKLFFFKQGEKCEIKTDGASEYITVSCDFFASEFDDIGGLPRYIYADDKNYKEVLEIAKIWQSSSWDSYILCKIKMLQFYLSVMRSHKDKLVCEDETLKIAVEYVHNNFKRRFSTEDVARECGMSSPALRNRFTKTFGMTISDYRDNLRLNSAKEMLATGEFSINETAKCLGFFDPSHFSKFFSKRCGISPRNFMKSL